MNKRSVAILAASSLTAGAGGAAEWKKFAQLVLIMEKLQEGKNIEKLSSGKDINEL